jgi:polyisoprenoid-binding protein YceI
VPAELVRRFLLLGGVACAVPLRNSSAAESLTIGSTRGSIDFSIGDSRIFRTTGSFKEWHGKLDVDDVDVARSRVDVTVITPSIQMMDVQQTTMMKGVEFFDTEHFAEMVFRSTAVERRGDAALRVQGNVTLRGITRPMQLDVTVSDRRPGAPAGSRYARFRGEGAIRRSEFGMIKYLDLVGDNVDISIRAEAWR